MSVSPFEPIGKRLNAATIALVYAALGALWIIASGALLNFAVSDSVLHGHIEMLKGLVFIIATSGLLYCLLSYWQRDQLARHEQTQALVDRMLMHFYDQPYVGMTIVSPALGGWLQFNEKMCTMLGYSRKEFAKKTWMELIHPDELAAATANVKKLAKGALASISAETRYIHKDGSVVFAYFNLSCVRGTDGKAEFFVATVHDITELKRVAAEANFHARSLEIMGEIAQVGAWSLNVETMVLNWSQEIYRIFELERDNCPNLSLDVALAYFAPEAQATIQAVIRAAIDQGVAFDLELPMLTAKGAALWVRLQGVAVIENGKTVGLHGAFQDITALKHTERRAFQLLQAVEQSPVSVVITDREGTIEYVNSAFSDLTGYGRDEAIGQNSRLLKSGETTVDTYRDLWAHLGAGRSWKGVFQNRKKNGELFWENATISPIFNGRREVTHFLAVKEDVTERKRFVEQLECYKLHLEEIVQERTVELSEALEVALQAERVKDLFLANVSHELRTPLNIVIGLADLSLRTCTDPKQCDYLEKIVDAGKNLAAIVNDLLDLSKIAAGHLEFESIVFSPRQLLERGRSAVLHKAEEKGLLLTEHLAAGVPGLLIGDPQRIGQILSNLLSNAIKFTPAGRVDVRIGLCRVEINRVCLHIEVEDTGIGIDEADIQTLFRPFAQADASITRNYGGTGLGLTICKRLAEMMGGEIGVSSQLGKGSLFWVKIWLGWQTTEEAAQQSIESGSALEPILSHYKNVQVLVVDDQPVNLEIVEALLDAVGITPRLASNGQETLDILMAAGRDAFDLVLMDMQMPIMDGLSATRAIRESGELVDLPVIAMTAHAMAHQKKKATAAGVNDHISKPFDTTVFYRTLDKWIPRIKHSEPGQAESAPAAGFPKLKGIDTALGMSRFVGNVARYRHWLMTFSVEAPAFTAQIRQHLAAGKIETVCDAAHAFKGRVGMLAMDDLHPLVSALEEALRQGEPVDAVLLLVETEVEMLCTGIRNGFEADGSGSKQPL